MTGTGSPSGYTNEQKVTLNRSGYINLAGWEIQPEMRTLLELTE